MALSGWNPDKRLKLTIDSSKIDQNVSNFPVLVTLNSGTGQTNFDVTRVFDEFYMASADDDFTGADGSNPNSLLWQQSGSSDFLTIQNNKLNYNHGQPTEYTKAVRSRYQLEGDFDVQVDWEVVSESVPDSQANTMLFSVGSALIYRQLASTSEKRYAAGGGMWITLTTTHDSGKFRITRLGSTYIMYYWSGSQWEWDGDTNGITCVTSNTNNADVTLSSQVRPNGTWHTNFDNFTVVSGTLIWDGRRIAITDSEDNQLYTEIERWDYTNEEANLWVKVPTIVSGTDTTLYLYYDATVSGNTDYVGYVGETPAQNVWDSNFGGVWHMAQNPNGDVADAIKDSTSNINHGTPAGTMLTEDLVDGKIGKAIDFEGTDDHIDISTIAIGANTTFSWIAESDATSTQQIISGANTNNRMSLSNTLVQLVSSGATFQITHGVTITDWHMYTLVRPSLTVLNLYIDGVFVDSDTDGAGTSIDVYNIAGKDFATAWNYYNGLLDEIRFSTDDRTAAWINADFYSNWDDLIIFSEETTFIFSNPIPTDLSTVYGTTQQLYLTTTITGEEPNYIYDAAFYNAYDDGQISSTVSGTESGQSVGVSMSTPSGINYQWYMTATSSGEEDTSSTYTFTNKFLCEGQTQVNNVPASGIPVRLYRRSTSEYIGGATSTGISGTFEIETNYNEYHYATAFYNNTTANAIIQDWLIP